MYLTIIHSLLAVMQEGCELDVVQKSRNCCVDACNIRVETCKDAALPLDRGYLEPNSLQLAMQFPSQAD